MSFIYICPHCKKEIHAEDAWDGLEKSCPNCKKQVIIQRDCTDKDDVEVRQKTEEKMHKIFNKTTEAVKKHKGCCCFIIVISVLFLLGVVLFFKLIIYGMYASYSNAGKTNSAKEEIQLIKTALAKYNTDTGYYPSDLRGLVENIDKNEGWHGPYFKDCEIPRDPWNNEYQYIFPGDYGEYDLYSFGADGKEGGEGINADISINSAGPHYSLLRDWNCRIDAEAKGENFIIGENSNYDRLTSLPESDFFNEMASFEAQGQQYNDLRARGMNADQIYQYIVREKYLPLIRYVTRKQNISWNMELTDENWAAIKNEMLKRQMRGFQVVLNSLDNTEKSNSSVVYDSGFYRDCEDALSKIWDARLNAIRKGEEFDESIVECSDNIKNDPVIHMAVIQASRNIW